MVSTSLKDFAIFPDERRRWNKVLRCVRILTREIKVIRNLIWIFIRGLNNAARCGSFLLAPFARSDVVIRRDIHGLSPVRPRDRVRCARVVLYIGGAMPMTNEIQHIGEFH